MAFIVRYTLPSTGNTYFFKNFYDSGSGIKPLGCMAYKRRSLAMRYDFRMAWNIKKALDQLGYSAVVCYIPSALKEA